MAIVRWLWIVAGIICLILATIGIIMPLLPTTPLVILAAFCFSKGSTRLHLWLHNNRYFGPLLQDWETYGVIRTKSKVMATIAIILIFSLSLYFTSIHIFLKCFLVLLAFCLLTYIWSRPSYIEESETV